MNKKNEGMYSRKIGDGRKTRVEDEGNSVYRALSVNRIKWLDIFLDIWVCTEGATKEVYTIDVGVYGRIVDDGIQMYLL